MSLADKPYGIGRPAPGRPMNAVPAKNQEHSTHTGHRVSRRSAAH